jgi:hypothetical protein
MDTLVKSHTKIIYGRITCNSVVKLPVNHPNMHINFQYCELITSAAPADLNIS